MDITDRIIEKYKKDRSIKDEYVLNDDEMYLIDEIVQLKIGQTLPIDNVSNRRELLISFAEYLKERSLINVRKENLGIRIDLYLKRN
jgi:hypothetical protein